MPSFRAISRTVNLVSSSNIPVKSLAYILQMRNDMKNEGTDYRGDADYKHIVK